MNKPEKNATSTETTDASEVSAEPPTETLPLEEVPGETLRPDLPLHEHLGDVGAADAGDGTSRTVAAPRIPRPRIRWGAIAWGLIVGSVAIVTLSITRTAGGRADFALWLAQLGPAGIWLIVVLASGGILLLLGMLSAIRRLQRR